jgi:hypothetical protein
MAFTLHFETIFLHFATLLIGFELITGFGMFKRRVGIGKMGVRLEKFPLGCACADEAEDSFSGRRRPLLICLDPPAL